MPNCHCCGKSTNDRVERSKHRILSKPDVCYSCSRDGATATNTIEPRKKPGLKCKYSHKKKKRDRGNNKKRHIKLYAILKIVDGEMRGMIDESICSMNFHPDALNIWEKPPTHYSQGPKKDIVSESFNDGSFIVRLNSKKCPVIVELSERWPQRPRNYIFRVKKEAFDMYPELDRSKYNIPEGELE